LARQCAEETLLRLLGDGTRGQLAVAESCTGGLVAARITAVAGSSAYFDRGFVTYSNSAKVELLGVSPALLEAHGAVSSETALAMLAGVFERSNADFAAAVTGIAGPGGGTAEKPVGTVWVAWGGRGNAEARLLQLSGDRGEVRAAAADFVLARLCELAGGAGEA